MKYKYLEHTADAKLQAYGKTLEQAFVNAALGTFNIIFDPSKVKPKIRKKIQLTAKRDESLLYDFIDELLFLLDTEGFLLSKAEDMKISEGWSLSCTIFGDDFRNYDVQGNIKAVTYNDMFIKKKGQNYIIQLVLDL